MTETSSIQTANLPIATGFAPPKPIVVTVKNYIDAAQLKVDLAYSLTDLQSAFLKQASLYSHYGDLHAMAKHQVNDLKLKLDIAEAKIYRNTRDRCLAADEKFTEPYLQSCVRSHALVIAFKKAINEAMQVASSASTAVEAFHQRKGMLEGLGRGENADKAGELRIMDQNAREGILERARARVANKES